MTKSPVASESPVTPATPPAKLAPVGGTTNVGLCIKALERAISRAPHLPGMTAFYGPSGYGKSFAASYAASTYRAFYVACKSSWTRKAFLTAILREMGITPARSNWEMTDQIAEELVISGRPLIVDEMDHLVDKRAVETVRDIYEGSQSPILLIGEERMPNKLKAWERFHGRILDFVPAQAVDLGDVDELAKIYAAGITIHSELLRQVHKAANGSVRRVCVNLDMIREQCLTVGLTQIGARQWTRGFFTGEAPRRGLR